MDKKKSIQRCNTNENKIGAGDHKFMYTTVCMFGLLSKCGVHSNGLLMNYGVFWVLLPVYHIPKFLKNYIEIKDLVRSRIQNKDQNNNTNSFEHYLTFNVKLIYKRKIVTI